LLGGCAAKKPPEPPESREGEVTGRVIGDETAEAYPVAQTGETYYGPFPFEENAPPQYPADQLARNLPLLIVRARIIVDENGSVTHCLPLADAADSTPEFFAAVQSAMLAWKFVPLIKTEAGPGSTLITFHNSTMRFDGKAQALAYHQDYEFTFTQRDGKGTVSSSQSR
jgi:hypothetical protein